MGIGASIFLVAVGAILTFALETEVSGIDLDTVGIILMVVGIIGLLFTMLVWGRRDVPVERTVVRERDREVL
ncbi:MAG: hypothetical protein QOH90_718 [Actinomycetota bacterium]|jgi:hypothetical protein|nr:hypothetical protein [Actinomycetota bacterium]